ncbi:MAG: single-stranded DNA-binding protein [Phycisphaerae bacterium]|nr:single-stranded DNA-binding protein [Phycisphaerae bacterium]
MAEASESLVRIARQLARDVGALSFGAHVACVYHPLEYAWDAHKTYLERFGRSGIEALLVGMNPGPFGMVQTGVPFGEVALVRDFLGIQAAIQPPQRVHPKRPVLGFECTRSEVSGRRVWGWARTRFETPERFFERFFIWNWCPLAFVTESGANLTPDKLPAAERTALERVCDDALLRVIEATGPRIAIGFGGFATARVRSALGGATSPVVGTVLHPSPASPAANRGWEAAAERDLAALGITMPGVPGRSKLQRSSLYR